MSQATWCRLCVTNCHDYVRLYDENGHCKVDLYEITVKYFHPMFLAMLNGTSLSVMCRECWRQITDFDNFQKAILLAQSKLVTTADKQMPANPKDAAPVEEAFTCGSNDSGTPNENSGYGYVKKELELMDVHNDILSWHNVSSTPEMDKFPNTYSPLHHEDDDSSPNEDSMYHDIEPLPEEYDDPVGVFCGGEFNDDHDYIPPSLLELDLIEVNTDDEFSVNATETGINEQIARQEDDNNSEEISIKTNLFEVKNEIGFPANMSPGNTSRRTPSEQLDEDIAKWLPTLDCPICNEPLPNFAVFGEHFKERHPHEKCYVQCCQRKFYSRSTLAEHARLHIDPDEFKCDLCDKTCGSTKALMKHKHGQHRKYKSSTSKITKKSAKELDGIIAQWKPNLECVLCTTTHPTFTLLQRHFQLEHPSEKFYIECCQQKLELRWQAADHMQLHINPNAFKCQLCGRFFTSSRNLYAHMYYTHSMTAGGATVQGRCYYKCSRCDKQFSSRGCLQEHMAMHAGQELYQCLYCPQTFRYRTKLYSHLKREHTQEWVQKKNIRSLYKLMEIRNHESTHVRQHIPQYLNS